MKTKYTLFRRGEMFYIQDTATGKQTSLRTKDETEAHTPRLLCAMLTASFERYGRYGELELGAVAQQ